VVDEHAPDLRARAALGELEARVLQVEERLAEGLALARVARGERYRLLGRDDRAERDLQPLVGKLLHHLREAAALGAPEQVRSGHARAVEGELARVLARSEERRVGKECRSR